MTNPNPFENQENLPQEDADNQPALRIPRVDRQRDEGSGLVSGTAPGIDSIDAYQYEGARSVGPGSGIGTGQYRGSDEGTTTDPNVVSNPGDNQGTDLARDEQSSANYQPGTSHDPNEATNP